MAINYFQTIDSFLRLLERCEEMILSVQYIEDPTGYGTGIQKYCAAFTQGAKDSRGMLGGLTSHSCGCESL